MKHIIPIIFSLSVLLTSCVEGRNTKILQALNSTDTLLEIPDTSVDKSILHYNNKISLWTLNGQPYSGYTVSFYQDSTLKEKTGIFKGRKENQSIYWHPDGHFRQITFYHKGKLHGEKKVWSPGSNHVLISQLNYHLGKPHGEQKKWYRTGELHKILHLNMGQEEGIQKAFRPNGDLYANYEAKNGRVFGLKKGALCFGLEDENIQYEK